MSSVTATSSPEVVCAVEYLLLDILLDGFAVVLVFDSTVGTEDLWVYGPGGITFAYLLADKLDETGGAYLLADGIVIACLLADSPEGVDPTSRPEGCCVVEDVWCFLLEKWSLGAADAYLLAANPPYFVLAELSTSIPTFTVGTSLLSWLGDVVMHLSSTFDMAFGIGADLGNAVLGKALEIS